MGAIARILSDRYWRLRNFLGFRSSGLDPRDDLPCEWCERVVQTTVADVWNGFNPKGRKTRLCRDCEQMCAG